MDDINLPEGWSKKTLGEILPKECLKEVLKFLNRKGEKSVNELKTILKKYESDLLKNGVLPDYLAYFLQYRFGF